MQFVAAEGKVIILLIKTFTFFVDNICNTVISHFLLLFVNNYCQKYLVQYLDEISRIGPSISDWFSIIAGLWQVEENSYEAPY